ncbi:MAG: hypothetical protein AABX02_00240 [archaeon]
MSEKDEDSVTPETREKLLAELKKKLKEIEELKASLQPQKGESSREKLPLYESAFDPGKVREAVEEISVPPLELLDDKPLSKKQKKEQERPSA